MKSKTCFETIKLVDGELQNLEYHQKRVDKTRYELWEYEDKLDLKKELKEFPKTGIYRLRVDYKKKVESSTCREYTPRKINTFKVVNSDIKYDYKYANRDNINELLNENYDDIIIVKDGFLSDTSIANIALLVEGVWLTPKTPLLSGTTRARLIEEGFLKCANLSIIDLEKAEKFAIMNALIDFKIIKTRDGTYIELGFECTL